MRTKTDLLKTNIGASFLIALLGACTQPTNEGDAGPDESVEAVVEQHDYVDVWLEQLEVGSRELYSARESVVDSVGLSEGDVVADIGSGTGLYSLLFAEEVGASGRVFAEDIEPLFLDLVNQRADDSGIDNITAVLGRENDVSLPEKSIDLVFIADTYHYFGDRQAVMKSVFDSMKPGGELVIVDYDLEEGETRASDKQHVRFGKAGVISELEYIGFEFLEDVAVEGLSENYFVRFKRPEE
ncbi:class I SAM-dependent methyltransferase [Hyphococcus sp. DH-69]|uniref:class I SAM-dependent methyltransferase n=1 Tax=Hyphococcus formosus TaxID=3143534 RepID=UPI00398A7155